MPLLHEFLVASTDDSVAAAKRIHDRMKLIVKFVNPAQIEMGSMTRSLVKQFNAKPVLTRPQHAFFTGTSSGPTPASYFELDLDVHIFNTIARRGFHSMISSMPQIVLDIGFVLEGKSDEELPEDNFWAPLVHCMLRVRARSTRA